MVGVVVKKSSKTAKKKNLFPQETQDPKKNFQRMSNIQKSYKALTRASYDDCAYATRLHESTSPLLYQINPEAYESCKKCHQAYPGFIGKMGGMGFGIGPDRVDIDSDLRGQTRLQSRCPSHKYNPHSYNYCGACTKCDQGLPCGCPHCRTRDVSGLKDCRPGIIPVEAQDTRAFDSCNPTRAPYIDRFDYLGCNPQSADRIFNYPDNRRLGAETRMDMRDYCGSDMTQAKKVHLKNSKACNFGGQGCRYVGEFNKGVLN